MSSTKSVNPSVVRAWATEQGITTGSKGKFSKAVIDAYNAANPKARYRQGKFVKSHLTVVKRAGRAPLRVNVNHTEARKALVAAGVEVPARGRLSNAAVEAFVLLGR